MNSFSFLLVLVRGRWHNLGLAGTGCALLGWRLAVTLFQLPHHHGTYELLFAVIVKLDHNTLLITGEHSSQAELVVLYLSALGIVIGSH